MHKNTIKNNNCLEIYAENSQFFLKEEIPFILIAGEVFTLNLKFNQNIKDEALSLELRGFYDKYPQKYKIISQPIILENQNIFDENKFRFKIKIPSDIPPSFYNSFVEVSYYLVIKHMKYKINEIMQNKIIIRNSHKCMKMESDIFLDSKIFQAVKFQKNSNFLCEEKELNLCEEKEINLCEKKELNLCEEKELNLCEDNELTWFIKKLRNSKIDNFNAFFKIFFDKQKEYLKNKTHCVDLLKNKEKILKNEENFKSKTVKLISETGSIEIFLSNFFERTSKITIYYNYNVKNTEVLFIRKDKVFDNASEDIIYAHNFNSDKMIVKTLKLSHNYLEIFENEDIKINYGLKFIFDENEKFISIN